MSQDAAVFGSAKDLEALAEEWTGLSALRGWLSRYGVGVILDVGECGLRGEHQLEGTIYFETLEDSASAVYGEAVRFHPCMFEEWRPDLGIPFGSEGKVHLAENGEWKVWSPNGFWVDVPISPIEFYDELSFDQSPIGANPDFQRIGLSYADSDRMLQAIRLRRSTDRFPEFLESGPTRRGRILARKMFPPIHSIPGDIS